MAENMQELKRRMKSIESTEHITNAMRLVSASKYKKAKSAFDKTSQQILDISHTMESLMACAASMIGEEEKPEAETPAAGTTAAGTAASAAAAEGARTLVIAIAGNRGLCGGFNANIIRQVLAEAEDRPKENLEIYAIGSKVRDYFEYNAYKIAGICDEAPEKITFADTSKMAKPIIEKFQKGEVAEILLVHTAYINSLKQEPVVKKLLPFETSTLENRTAQMEFDRSPQEILDYMIPKYFELVLFEAITESAACEYAARRSAMENATDNANDFLAQLSLTFNRVRQAAITNELIEIVSGADSQK